MRVLGELYEFAQWVTQNREEAEDLVQETYAKALKGFSSFQLGTNFRAWMYRILRNTFLTSRTGLKVTMTVPLDPEENGPELAVECETPETILFERANRELLQRAIDELPVYFREILLLCEVEEVSHQEISETDAAGHCTQPAAQFRARMDISRGSSRHSCGRDIDFSLSGNPIRERSGFQRDCGFARGDAGQFIAGGCDLHRSAHGEALVPGKDPLRVQFARTPELGVLSAWRPDNLS